MRTVTSMPRVVQVNSSSNLNENTRGNDVGERMGVLLEENESNVNRNYNQKESESLTTLRFNVNYGLYNVVYNPSEDDVYCLKCNIDGRDVKFKKDARVWLHKSNDLKRKFEEKEKEESEAKSSNKIAREDCVLVANQIAKIPTKQFDNSVNKEDGCAKKMDRIQQYFQNVFSGYGSYRRSKEVDSPISSLGDSEADLTYSEEESSSESLLLSPEKAMAAKIKRKLKPKSTADSEIPLDVTATSSTSLTEEDKLIASGITEFMDDFDEDLINASGNNNQVRAAGYAIARKFAPAIEIEKESLNESMLDSAVNNFSNDCVAAHTRYRTRRR